MSDVPATLAAEADGRRWAVPAAIVGALLPLAALLIGVAVLRGPQNRLAYLIHLDEKQAIFILLGIVLSVGILGLTATLVFLYDAIKARRPAFSPVLRPVLIIGGVGTAVVGVLSSTLSNAWPQAAPFQIVAGARIHDFVTSGPQTYQSSQDVFTSPLVAGMTFAQILFTLLLVVGLVVISINAMRIGLLTRVIGWIGVFAGILFAFPILSPVPIVPAVWLGALALILSGRFPGGTPPAWASGEAQPWTSLSDQRERALAAREQPEAEADAAPDEPAATAAVGGPARPGAARRKRKKRR